MEKNGEIREESTPREDPEDGAGQKQAASSVVSHVQRRLVDQVVVAKTAEKKPA